MQTEDAYTLIVKIIITCDYFKIDDNDYHIKFLNL